MRVARGVVAHRHHVGAHLFVSDAVELPAALVPRREILHEHTQPIRQGEGRSALSSGLATHVVVRAGARSRSEHRAIGERGLAHATRHGERGVGDHARSYSTPQGAPVPMDAGKPEHLHHLEGCRFPAAAHCRDAVDLERIEASVGERVEARLQREAVGWDAQILRTRRMGDTHDRRLVTQSVTHLRAPWLGRDAIGARSLRQ